MSIREDFSYILSNYIQAKSSLDLLRNVRTTFSTLQKKLENLECIKRRQNIIIKFGTGIGTPADCPWLALLDTRETDTTRKGVYCAYLFRADMSGVFATFNQGVGASASEAPKKERILEVQKIAKELQDKMRWLEAKGFLLDPNIALKAHSVTGKAYEKSTIAYKFYERNNLPSDDKIEAELSVLLDAYDQYLENRLKITPTKQTADLTIVSTPVEEKQQLHSAYTIEQFSNETGFDSQTIRTWLQMLNRKQHLIFQGPPGTGKTFVAQRLAKLLVSGTNGFISKVQFHPDYNYEDFIQGYFPDPESGVFRFRPKKGLFLKFCDSASTTAHNDPCVMIIDEINRANLSRVFGELMYLLEYREDKIPLATGEDPFQIPSNVFLIGTMNTADRSIALVDHALRRRFSFVRLKPEYEILKRHIERFKLPADSLIKVLREVNLAIDDPNYEMGISFFMRDGDRLREFLPIIWKSEIESYLEEYFYDQPNKVQPFRYDSLILDKLKDWVT